VGNFGEQLKKIIILEFKKIKMALYLKYRPQDFKSLVGQEFVKNTLQKAVAENKTVGAYLLC